MTITANYTKMLSLKIWRYFAEHPEISHKDELPDELFSQIKNMVLNCPLCEFFLQNAGPILYCSDCPLNSCNTDGSLYNNWARSTSCEERKHHAQKIVDAIDAWDTDSIAGQ